jgi:hypothetical protein
VRNGITAQIAGVDADGIKLKNQANTRKDSTKADPAKMIRTKKLLARLTRRHSRWIQ